MNKIELAEKIKAMREAAEREEKALVIKWNKENSPVKVGDVVKDHADISIKVEKIRVASSGREIKTIQIGCCVYEGIMLKKNGEPYKNRTAHRIWQCNLTEINGVPYAMEQD